MPQFVFKSPEGKEYVVNGPEGSTQEQAWGILQQQMGGALPTQPTQPEPPGVFSQILGAPKEVVKGFVRGLTVDPISGLTSLGYTGARAAGAEMTPFEQTGFGQALGRAQTALAPSDAGLITQFAGGVGSLASFLPGGLLKGGIKLATLGAQATGVGTEEARARAEQARLEGKEVTPQQQFQAQLGGAAIGLTELAPVERLVGPLQAVLRGIPADKAAEIAPGLFNSARRMLVTGGIEGLQEGMANIAQDLVQKGIYDPNLEVGQSALGDAAMGASVGAFAQGAIELVTKGKRTQMYERLKAEEREKEFNDKMSALQKEEQEQIDRTKQNLGVPDTTILALPAPSPQVETKEERDPLMNPVGFFNANELTPQYLKAVNDIRDKEGKAKLQQFSVEDLADAGAPQGELDRLLTYKTGFDGSVKLSPSDVLNLAQQKNVDTSTVGFTDFLRRSTGSFNLNKMSQPQLFSAFKALDELSPSETLQVLPQGTNATRFTQEQYDKSLKSLTSLFPESNLLGRSSVLQEIKDYSGLESDRDAESLLQTAIRKGDLETVSRNKYDLVDADGKTVRTYLTRASAERAARETGLSVREATSINIALPGKATELPGGPDIRKGTFQEGTEPAGFEVRSPDAVLSTSKTQEEAEAKADRLASLRIQKAQGFLGQAQKVENEIAKSNQKLESMEADGKADTLEYKLLDAKIAANNKNLQNQADRLKAKADSYAQPLEIAPKGEKPTTREGFTLFEEGKPVATFPNQQAAEEAALTRLPDDILQRIVNLAPAQKGLMPKRLGAMARDELARRAGQMPEGIGVSFRGTREEAEARLAEAGIFTGEFKKKADELSKKLRPIMDKLGLKDLRLNIEKAIMSPMGEADGYYAQHLIAISMSAPKPIRTLRHEGIHALKELGAFTPDQWKVLEKRAREEWMSKYKIADRYKGLDLESQLEEAISDAFSDFDQNQPPAGMIGALFRKIKQFLEALGNSVRGMGFQTADSIFTDIEAGRMTPDVSIGKEPPSPMDRVRYQLSQAPRVMSTGKIVGAPPGMSTEADRKKLIAKMTKLLDHPFTMFDESRFWYENSGDTIREITRANPELMERVVRLMSLYSQANSLGGNTTATIKSVAQLAQGAPTALAGRFPNETAKRIPAILSAPTMDSTLPGVDDKLMNFYRNLRDATFKQDTFADASTVDRWMMRLFGYPHAEDQDIGGATGVSNTQYLYAKDLLQRIADAESKKTGEVILPRQIQAALWTYVRNKTEYDSLPKDQQANFVPKNIDFADYVTRATANITWESRPSTSLPLIPGIHKASRKDQEAFNRAVRNIFVDPETGEDKIFKLLDNQQLYSSDFSEGAYENLIAPNIITKLVLQKDEGGYLTSVADNYAAIVGYVTKQDAVPWYRADPTASGKDASVGFRVTPSIASTPEFEEKLFKHLNTAMPGVGFTRVGGSFDFINFRDVDTGKPFGVSDKKYTEQLQSALRTFAPDVNFTMVPFRAKSGWISNNWKENPDGQGYLDRLRTAGLGDLQRVIDGWSEDYNRIADDFGREYGWSDPRQFSLRSSIEGDGISLGERQPGAITVDAVHYGKQKVPVLTGRMYGTGIRGAEARRLADAEDARISNRVYFYVPQPNGRMPIPESGLGGHVYIQRFNNVLGPGEEMTRLSREAGGDANTFESSVIDAGYDGYAIPDMGMMVILNNDVPVEYRGTRDEVSRKAPEETVQIGDRRYALRQTDTPEFKQWFGNSKVVASLRGEPKRMYHGTARDISEFRPKQADAIFVTDSPNFAESFAGTSEDFMVNQFIEESRIPEDPSLLADIKEQAISQAMKDGVPISPRLAEYIRQQPFREAARGSLSDYFIQPIKDNLPSRANIMPLYVRAENPFDFQDDGDVQGVIDYIAKNKTPKELYEAFNYDIDVLDDLRGEIKSGKWITIENPVVQEAIKSNRHDGFYVMEGGKKNLAVYDPNQVKSAIGNIGTFSRTDKDIRYALALGNIEPSTAVVPDDGGNPSGNLGLLPEKLGGKPVRLLVGTHDDIENKGYGANHILNRVLSDPRRMPEGSEETLEKIARTAQRTAQNYRSVFKDGNKLVLFDGKNSLVLSTTPDQASIVTMFTQTNPQQKYGAPVWTGRAPLMPEFLEPVRGMPIQEREGRVAPKAKPVEFRAKRVITPSEVTQQEPTTPRIVGTLGIKKMPAKMSLALPREVRKTFFDGTEYIPTSDSVETIRSNWIGGVSGIGDRDLAYQLPNVEGGQEYIDMVQDSVRENLGDSFKGYRLMSIDEFEELKTGAMGSQLASFTLDPDFAIKFSSIPRYSKMPKGDLIVVEMDLTPDHVQMIGHRGESEVVIDYGIGYNPDEVNGYASPVSPEAPKKFSLRAPETTEFKRWFGDSKVVDEKGNPLVVYHGTSKDKDFNSFNVPMNGAWFTSDPELASAFATGNDSQKLKWDSDTRTYKELNTASRVVPVFLRIENPYQMTKEDFDGLKFTTNYKKYQADFFNRLRAQGHDGVSFGDGVWVAIGKPAQIKSAFNQQPTIESKDLRFSMRDTLDQGTVDAIERTTTVRKEQGFAERMMEAISPQAFARFRQGMINKYEGIERLSRDVAEKFGSKELLADTSAIAAALFSDRASGVAASAFRNGVPVYKDGFTTVSDLDGKAQGLIPILEPLAKYGDPFVFQAFQFYAATKRGKRLTAEGREKLFTPEDIKKGELLERQYPEFKRVFDEYQQFNKGLVDFMKDTGVLSAKEAEIWTQNWDYIPFYRQMDGDRTAGPNVFAPIAGVAKPKKLKGGDAPLADFMETVVRNARAAIEAGMKNAAAQKVVRDIIRLNQGELVPPTTTGADIVTVKENGLTKHYRVDDPLLVESLKGLNLPQLPFVEILAKPAELLRNLVTKDPGFMLANLMRDSLQAWTTTGTNITPIVDTFKQWGMALANMSPEARALAKAGLFTGYDFAGDVKSATSEVESELRKRTNTMKTAEKALMPLSKIWEALEKGSTASDVATRAEVYKRVLKETGNEAEAMYQAMEVLNFSRRGSSALIRILTAVVPFMNARIQGLDVLYRAGFGKMATATRERQQKAFMTRGLTLLALSAMYWALASDTEEYETAEQEVRDNNWIIGNVRIPIPFEIGTVFKVFPERILEYFFGMDTGKDLKDSVVRNVTSTLAFNPIPQAFMPVIENISNYSFFTGQPIVGKGMEDVAARYQATPGTSLLAQEIGEATNTSPIKVDNLIRGYTGTLGTYAVMALDAIMRGEGDPTKAAMRAEQMPVIKRFFASPEGTGTVTAYYELKGQVDEATRTINFLERTGGYEDLQAYMQDKGAKLIAIKPYIQTLDKDMKMLRELRRAVQVSSLDPQSKRDVLDNIRSAEVAMTSRIQYLKKSIE